MIKTVRSFPQRIMHCLVLLLALSLLYGCGAVGGGRSSSLPATQRVSITVAPLAADVRAGGTVQFSAMVSSAAGTAPSGSASMPTRTGATQNRHRLEPHPSPGGAAPPGTATKQVIWSINGIRGGNAAVGTISANGLYNSPSIPPSPNAVEVTATSVAEASVSQTALVTLYNPIPTALSVVPSKVSAGPFTLTLSGRGFVQGSQVSFSGTPLSTTFRSSTQLVARGVATRTQLGNAQVLVTNPEPGSASSSAALTVQVTPPPVTASPTPPPPVTAPSTAWNPAVLGVPWASDFVSIAANEINVKTDSRMKVKALGDGATDDTSAIRAAIQLASSSGGGVVYFPTGDYKIITASNSVRGNPLVVPSRVILRGASSSTSRIFINDPGSTGGTEGTWTWGGIDFYGSSLSGMTDLSVTVVAVATSSSPCATIWNTGSAGVQKLFFNNLNIALNNCRPLWFNGVNNFLLKDSSIDSNEDNPHADQVGPVYIVGNTNVSVVGNTFTYNFGRVQLWNNTNVLMQGNTLIRDAKHRDMQNGTAIESGGVQLSFDSNVQVLNNTIQTVNAPADEADDGEAIMSQLGSTANIIDAGSATAITSTTLTDTNALWGSVTVSRLAQYPNTVVAILSGSATGEVRTIQSFATSTKTLTVTQPWNPVPEVGSLYSVFSWTLMNALIQGNVLIGNPNGIELYDGCYNCIVQNNTLTDSRGILLRTVDILVSTRTYPETRRIHEVAINAQIVGNTVSNISGIRPAYIALDAEGFARDTYRGMGIMNVRVENNVISPYSGSPNQTYLPGANELSHEGFFPCFLYGPASVKDPVTTVFQNINYWNNTLNTPVTLSSDFLPFATHACVTSSTPSANTP